MTQLPPSSQPANLEAELEKKLGEIQGHQKESDAEKLAKELKLPFSNLKVLPIDAEALVELDEKTARAAHIAILQKTNSALIIAVTDPRLPQTKEVISQLTQRGFRIETTLITTQEALEQVWKRYQTTVQTDSFEVGAIDIKEEDLEELQKQVSSMNDLKNQVTKTTATKLLEILVAGGLKIGASDIHFEPEQATTRLRYRLDGLLQDVTNIDADSYHKVLNRIKILSKLKLNVHQSPQDGRFTIRQKNTAIEVRVSVLPSEYGETIVMRLLDPRSIKSKLEDLGMRPDLLELVKQQLAKPNGTLLTTGPTGSGKTTTLYAFINHLNAADTKIITVEDPIEYHIQGISQTQVDPSKGYTFAGGLRAIVRQDPDIILIGEIRDFETADIALHAALTGHVVLSTIHTNDAAGTIPRLIDLGVKPETIAPAVSMAMGQRLVRRLCEKCKQKTTLSPQQVSLLKESLEGIRGRLSLPEFTETLEVYAPGKCDACNQLGYKGRVGVYEVLTMTRAMEQLISKTPTVSDIRDLAISEGMITMTQDGYLKVLAGVTSLEEVGRILGG